MRRICPRPLPASLAVVVVLSALPIAAAAAPTDRKEDDQFLVFHDVGSFTIPAAPEGPCPFEVVQHFDVWIKIRLIERDGTTQVGADSVHGKLLWENPASGKTSDVTIATHSAVYVNGDGTVTVVVTGVQGRDTIPGAGIVVGDIGRFVFTIDEETGELLRVESSGAHHTEGPFPELCEHLA